MGIRACDYEDESGNAKGGVISMGWESEGEFAGAVGVCQEYDGRDGGGCEDYNRWDESRRGAGPSGMGAIFNTNCPVAGTAP